MPSPTPANGAIRIELPDTQDAKRAIALQDMKSDVINYLHAPQGAKFKKDAWKNLVVGDFVRIYNDDELPADVIILATSDPDGACYVETKNLDGETNLKVRQALRCGRKLRHARDCERAEFVIESEPPQPNLYKYNGAIRWQQLVPGFHDDEPEDMQEPITIDNLLLRGCNLRNTEWVLGVVVYTGHDTKIMMNAGITPSKRSRIAREMNFNVICNFGILLIMCLLAAIVNGVAWAKTDASLYFFDFGSIGGTAPMSGFITFWAAIIVFQNLVPISLYITLEIVRTLQAIFIFSDVEMYYEKIDQPCIPKSWNISDDVGQIEYIFSDKTGTLTRGAMTLVDVITDGDHDEFLKLAGSLESGSEHPIGKAVALGAEERDIELEPVEEFESIQGKGARGRVADKTVLVGKALLFTEAGFSGVEIWQDRFNTIAAKGNTTFLVGWDGEIQGVLSVADTVRPTSAEAINELHRQGISTVMLTGDSRQTADAIASAIGIDEVVAEMLPGEKSEAVAKMQANGQVVAFVGDGINDAPALTMADLGMAVGSGTDVAIEAGDVVLMSGDPLTSVTAIKLARKTFTTIKQNLFWAFAYNTAAIPLAALGFLNPMVAAAAMAFSSVSVVANSVRLRRYDPR